MPLKGRNGELLGRAVAWQLGGKELVLLKREILKITSVVSGWPRW